MIIRSVCVNNKSYRVHETPDGYLKAHLNGILGWDTVWAESYTQLVRRIKWVLAGGQ